MGTAVLLCSPQYLEWHRREPLGDGEYVLHIVPLLLAVDTNPRLRDFRPFAEARIVCLEGWLIQGNFG